MVLHEINKILSVRPMCTCVCVYRGRGFLLPGQSHSHCLATLVLAGGSQHM